jgi:CheY-like chemotaxis protein
MAMIHVVDDETAIRLLVGYILRSLGHTVELHASSDELFAKLSHSHADLIITDFIMPRTDGFDVCRRLRNDIRTAPVPIIVMTGFELEPIVAETLRSSLYVAEILPKPFFAERLIDTVRAALKNPPRVRPESAGIDDVSEARIVKAVRAVGQRLQPRIDARIPIAITWEGASTTAITSDVSTTGLYALAEEAPAPNSDVTIAIVAEGKAPIVLQATVAHVRKLDDGGFGFGLALTEHRVQNYYAWYQLIARLQAKQREAGTHPRRNNTRAPLMGEVRVEIDTARTVTCTLGDISMGGMRLFGEAPIPSEALVTVHFRLPADEKPRKSQARVRWMQRQSPGRLVYGLAFEDTETHVEDAILDYVNALAARPMLEAS